MSSKFRLKLVLGAIPLILISAFMVWTAWSRKRTERTQLLLDHAADREAEFVKRHVKSRQRADESSGANVVNLEHFVNSALTDSPSTPKGVTADNLAELPKGVHIYAGIPFDVEGSIQLMGRRLNRYGKRYPATVESIPIDRHCAKLHFLHGSSFLLVKHYGAPVAKAVLHYADGTTNEFCFVAGEQAFDWWGPVCTYSPNKRLVDDLVRFGFDRLEAKAPAPDTELAWVGSNPWLQRLQPELSLRLFRSTFSNPRPEEPISSLDYVSTLTETAPFLVGLTVE